MTKNKKDIDYLFKLKFESFELTLQDAPWKMLQITRKKIGYKNRVIFNKLLLEAIVIFSTMFFISFISSAQNVGVNETGAAPDASALLDLSSTDKGFLITRADTANILSPAFGLMTLSPIDSCLYMYSGLAWKSMGGTGRDCPCSCTDTGCELPTDVVASVGSNPLCEGNDLSLIGEAIDATSWSWSGPNGFTSTSQNPTITGITSAEAGVYTLIASNSCGDAAIESTELVVVNLLPTAVSASAASNIAGDNFQANWAAVSGATNYYIDVASDADFTNLVITNQSVGNVTTYNVSGGGITCLTDYYYRIRAENDCGTSTNSNTITVTTGICCATNLVIGDFHEGGIVFEVTPPGTCQTGKIVSLEEWNGDHSTANNTASNYTGGGFNNWELPTRAELAAIFSVETAVNAGLVSNSGTVIPANRWYWSSEVSPSTEPYTLRSFSTNPNDYGYSFPWDYNYFRAIRTF